MKIDQQLPLTKLSVQARKLFVSIAYFMRNDACHV